MSKLIEGNPWVWVIVQGESGTEQFVGLHDQVDDADYIPAFMKKEAALQCFINLPREKGIKYETQAVRYEELVKDAANSGFKIFLLNGEGQILEKIDSQK